MLVIHANTVQWVGSSHDPIDNVAVKRLFTASTLPAIEQGDFQFVNWAVIPVGKGFSSHYHGDTNEPKDPSIGMSEFFIILEGEGSFKGGSITEQVGKGDLVYIPRGEIHSLTNIGKCDLVYVCFGVSRGGKTVVV